ncbi:Serine/threonine-protein phosphatase PGAM5 isoform 2 [Schistosoma japonicum]|uniref:Serine/threonine-protein phosphatase PGAM5, mitochondrial n=1 Tax=Schistosoma japonicum TaxID=6182 RepID=C1L4A5_SCHJA|nr:Serine/threonine-protein phosphatase PGAM5 isoform 2 [Schistosoma japonicum]CAX69533.1 phosphoglycerate mutase [Schistosoma japonicum]
MFFGRVLRLGCCVASLTLLGAKVAWSASWNKDDRNRTAFEQLESTVTNVSKTFPSVVMAHTVNTDNIDIKPWDWDWDGKHSSYYTSDSSAQGVKVIPKPKCTRHLLFIRHGQYHYAKDDADCHLTGLGRQQLNCTGLRLRELNFPYKKVYYSTMTRAVESAELVLNHLPNVQAEPADILREGAPYVLEPPLAFYQPTQKDLEEDGSRIESAFQKFVHRADLDQETDTYEVFVCHANVIRYFVCRALQFQPEAWIRFSLDHGSITWLVIRSDGRVTLRWLGNSGHMPPELISVQ